jgi:transposase-like protein
VFIVLDQRFTIGVHKAELQLENGRRPDYVVVDKIVIRVNDEQYWLYAAVNSNTNEFLHTKLEPTGKKVLAHAFFAELREKYDVGNVVFLVDGATPLQDACHRHGFDSKRKTRTSKRRRTCL